MYFAYFIIPKYEALLYNVYDFEFFMRYFYEKKAINCCYCNKPVPTVIEIPTENKLIENFFSSIWIFSTLSNFEENKSH